MKRFRATIMVPHFVEFDAHDLQAAENKAKSRLWQIAAKNKMEVSHSENIGTIGIKLLDLEEVRCEKDPDDGPGVQRKGRRGPERSDGGVPPTPGPGAA